MANLSNINNKFLVTTGGNVGIGVTGPTAKLHIGVSSANDDTFHIFNGSVRTHLLGSESSNGVIYLRSSANSNKVRINTYGDSYFNGGNVGIGVIPASKLDVLVGGDERLIFTTGASAPLIYAVNAANNAYKTLQLGGLDLQFQISGSEKMRIDSSGNVGIGETSPTYKLHVISATTPVAIFTGANNAYVDFSDPSSSVRLQNSGHSYFGTQTNTNLNFKTNGSQKMTILAGGNVGIGTTSPGVKLEVDTNSTFAGAAQFGNSTGNRLYILNDDGGNRIQLDAISSGGASNLIFSNGGSESMRIASTGNVGIGTTTPDHKLRVNGDARLGNLHIKTSDFGSGGTGKTIYADGAGSGVLGFISTTAFDFSNGSTSRVRIDSSGNVGIGITNPSGVLHIKKDNATAAFNIQGGLNNQTTAGTITSEINFRSNDGSTTGGIATAIKSVSEIYNGAHNGLAFYTGQQSRTPYLKQMLYFTAAGGLSFGDTNTAYGAAGQVLTSNGDASPSWIDGSAIPGVPAGSGTLNTIPLWTPDGNTLGNSIITQPTSAEVRVAGTLKVNSTVAGYSSTKIQTGGFGDSQSGINILNSTTGYGYILFGDGSGADLYRGQISYKHGDDFMTFNTAGSQRMTINSAGNVGVGTTSPGAKLVISGGGGAISDNGFQINSGYGHSGTGVLEINPSATSHIPLSILSKNGQTANLVNVTSFGGTAGNLFSIASSGNVGIGYAAQSNIRTFVYDNSANYSLAVQQDGSGIPFQVTSGGSVRMIVANNGNVGIGTTGPSDYNSYADNLVVADSAHSGISIASGTTSLGTLMFADGTGGTAGYRGRVQYDHNTDSMNFHTAAAERMRITSAGNVGIGTTGPVQKLHIVDTDGANIILNSNTVAENNGIWMTEGGVATPYANGAYVHYDSINNAFKINTGTTSLTTKLTILRDNGNVGIGTTSPDNILHIRKGDTTYASQVGADTMLFLETTNVSNALQFTSTNTGQQYIMFGDDDPNAGWISYNHSDNNLNFRVNATERMRIDSSGNVGIGTTTPDSRLDVTGGDITVNVSGTGLMNYKYNNSVVGSITTNGVATAFNTSSDYRLKEDLQDFAGLDMVSKIPVYNFKWKTDESRSYGVMAHELQEVLPDAVVGEKDAEEMQGVDYSKIVPLLVKSIQELEAKIKILENK